MLVDAGAVQVVSELAKCLKRLQGGLQPLLGRGCMTCDDITAAFDDPDDITAAFDDPDPSASEQLCKERTLLEVKGLVGSFKLSFYRT